jgi:hypothetical protein
VRQAGRDAIRRHLSYANVTATLALLLAMGGGAAYAVDRITSHDIKNNSLKSIDLKNHKAVRAEDVKPNSLKGRLIDETTLRVAPLARVSGTETGDCVLQDAPTDCVTTTIGVSQPSKLLVIATGNQESVAGPAKGSCRIAIDGAEEPLSIAPGEATTDNTDANATNGFARTLLPRNPVAAGQHMVALRCQRLLGQARIDNPTIAVVAIGAH